MSEDAKPKYSVLLTQRTARDIELLHHETRRRKGDAIAIRHMNIFKDVISRLTESPEIGICPPELAFLGVFDYRELKTQCYRFIYRVAGNEVVLCLAAPIRRDLHSLLAWRLISAHDL